MPSVITMLPIKACVTNASLILRGSPCGMKAASVRWLRYVRHAIPGTLHRMQQLFVEWLVDGLAQVVQMAAQRIRIRQAVAPDLALDLLATDHARRFAHQDGQQAQANGRKLQLAAAARDAQAGGVEHQVGDLEHLASDLAALAADQ